MSKQTGARVEFHGTGAGLGHVSSEGDRNDAANYVLFCGCSSHLGPLARFPADAQGRRAITCPICEHVTVVDGQAQVMAYKPIDAFPGLREKFERAKVGHAKIVAENLRKGTIR